MSLGGINETLNHFNRVIRLKRRRRGREKTMNTLARKA